MNATAAGAKDADFFAELIASIDRELGFEPWDEAQAQELFEAADPVPLAPGSRDDTVHRVRRDPPPPPSGSGLRRMLLPLGALALAAAAVEYWRWQGGYSTNTLPYEQAFVVVLDPSYDVDDRRSALSVLYMDAQSYVEAVRQIGPGPGPLPSQAAQALEHVRLLLEGSLRPTQFPPPGPVPFKELIEQIADETLPASARSAALTAAAALFEPAVYAVDSAKAMEPDLALDAKITLAKWKRVLEGKDPSEVTWGEIEGK